MSAPPASAHEPRRVMLVAVEPSADAIGASLIRALRRKSPDISLCGCGGPLMAAEGFKSAFETGAFAVIGFADVARVYLAARARALELAQMAATNDCDAAVFIDGWAFARLCATRFGRIAPRTVRIKYVAPQVWASRPQRVDFVRDHFDGVLCLLPFEPPWFNRVGAKAEFVGNPNFQEAYRQRGDGLAFRQRWGLGDRPVLAVLFGSRRGELSRHFGVFTDVVERLRAEMPEIAIVTPLAPGIAAEAETLLASWRVSPIIPREEEKFNAFSAATVALAVSGTVTTELAINKTPMVVAYRIDPVSALWVRFVITAKFVSIVNIAFGREIVPEFLQERCRPEIISSEVSALLHDAEARDRQRAAFVTLVGDLGVEGPDAADLAAERVFDWCRR